MNLVADMELNFIFPSRLITMKFKKSLSTVDVALSGRSFNLDDEMDFSNFDNSIIPFKYLSFNKTNDTHTSGNELLLMISKDYVCSDDIKCLDQEVLAMKIRDIVGRICMNDDCVGRSPEFHSCVMFDLNDISHWH